MSDYIIAGIVAVIGFSLVSEGAYAAFAWLFFTVKTVFRSILSGGG